LVRSSTNFLAPSQQSFSEFLMMQQS